MILAPIPRQLYGHLWRWFVKFSIALISHVLVLMAAPVFAQSTDDFEPVPNVACSPSHSTPASAQHSFGKRERNRIWRLFNNNCVRRHGETDIETNMCVAMHRDTPMPQRRDALQFLLDIGMIDFHGFSMDFMSRGLANSPPSRVLYVTRLIATGTRLGIFLTELCDDERRMLMFLNRQQIPLE